MKWLVYFTFIFSLSAPVLCMEDPNNNNNNNNNNFVVSSVPGNNKIKSLIKLSADVLANQAVNLKTKEQIKEFLKLNISEEGKERIAESLRKN